MTPNKITGANSCPALQFQSRGLSRCALVVGSHGRYHGGAAVAQFCRSTLKRDRMSSACYRRQQRQQRPEAPSVSSVTSCDDATVSHPIPVGAASDHPRPPREPRSLPRHGGVHFLTKSRQPRPSSAVRKGKRSWLGLAAFYRSAERPSP
jgi:hypothetical protein